MPRKLATLCYVRHEGKTLMLLRNKKEGDYHQGKWNGLGGKLEAGESPEQCMKREVLEESGLSVEDYTCRGFITFPGFDGENDWYVWLFTIEGFSGELIDSPEGELHWIADDKLFDLNLWEGDRVFMRWLSSEGYFSAIFRYEQGKFLDYEVEHYA